jgi:four helix bundle protein
MNLVEQVYHLTQAFPRNELYGLTGQIQRSAVSVPSNIAEGHTREHTREYLNHISIAQASLAELQTQIEIALRLGYLSDDEWVSVNDQLGSLGRQLYALRNALQRREINTNDADSATLRPKKPRPLTPGPQPPRSA